MANPAEILNDFRDKEFLDQILVLNDLVEAKDSASLPGLRDLFDNPLGDASIDAMVVNALMAVVGNNEAVCVEGLEDPDPAFSMLCIRAAGEHAFSSAAAPLIAMAESEAEPDRLHEIHTALAHIKDPASLDVFRAQLDAEDPLAQALALEMIGRFQDAESQDRLMDVVLENAKEGQFEECRVTTWKAVEALGAIGTDEALSFLAEQIHHPNPTARRVISDTLTGLGEAAVEPVLAAFSAGDTDCRVLCANALGFLGLKAGGEGLLAAYDRGEAEDPNVRYAVYEALGRIGTMKGLVCLMDGLKEEDELILMAVVGGLERHVNPGMVDTLRGLVAAGDGQSERLAEALVASRATNLFTALYPDEQAASAIMAALCESQDPETVGAFNEALKNLAGQAETAERAEADLADLPATLVQGRVALAADDSRSMLALHRTILSDMGFTAKLAAHGQEALDMLDELLQTGQVPEVVVTDLNMPVMDGLELVQRLRDLSGCEDVPVVMVTTESENSQRDLASKTGVNAFVTKPFKPDDLKAAVNQVLGS